MDKRKRGRRVGNLNTRNDILSVARKSFSESGFAKTTIRKIADAAGVDVALVIQYFGSKDALFGETLAIAPESLQKIEVAVTGPVEGVAERLIRTFLEIWEGEESEPFIAMYRASVANESASLQLRSFLQARLVDTIGPHLPKVSSNIERAGLAITMLVGVVVGREIISVPTIKKLSHDQVVSLLSKPIQSLLTAS